MTVKIPNHVASFAFYATVRLAVQSLPQHQMAPVDHRFDELLARLSQSEQSSDEPIISSMAFRERGPDHR